MQSSLSVYEGEGLIDSRIVKYALLPAEEGSRLELYASLFTAAMSKAPQTDGERGGERGG